MSLINASGAALSHVMATHDGNVQVVDLQCNKCGHAERRRAPHTLSDLELLRQFFPRWQAKGVRGAKRTLCPKCKKK